MFILIILRHSYILCEPISNLVDTFLYLLQHSDGRVMTVGIPVGETGSPLTSDGLYLMAGMDVTAKGQVVALEMDLAQGGSLEIKVILVRQT